MRVVVISDTHCGHQYGLTPPKWWDDADTPQGKIQRAMWTWFESRVSECGPYDSAIYNGDLIDGKGQSSGGTELITSDRKKQCDMAREVIELVDAHKNHIIYGTPYHTGKEEDWEAVLADSVDADISNHEWYEYCGVVLDCKHKVSGSIIPHGRYTGPARDALWNTLWAEKQLQPKSDIIIRSHVHYHVFLGDGSRLVMTTPCLQAKSKYGAKNFSGTITLGFVIIEINNGGYEWRAETMDMQFMAAVAKPL